MQIPGNIADQLKSFLKPQELTPFEVLTKDCIVTETEVTVTYTPLENETISLASVKWCDPRAVDMPDDSALWCQLHELLADLSELQNIIETFRGIGSTLVRGKKSYMIKPIIDTTGATGWIDQKQYDDMKQKDLMPYQGTLARALIQLFEKE